MKYEWDARKNENNFIKHGIRFEEAVEIFRGIVFTAIDDRKDYGEIRRISIGEIYNIIIVLVVHTERNGKTRIITARRANKREAGKYHEYIKHIQKKN